ncbi:MAG TPA: hypothetical protein VF103_09625 [Polyangiaceae bacterium]
MLVLLGPSFEPSEASYQALARATGLVPYDLKTRLKPGAWGCVKVVGDLGQARELGSRLVAAGFPVVLVDQLVAHDPDRRHVPVHRIELRESDFVLSLKDREMTIPYRALTCIVEGEVQPGRASAAARTGPQGSPSSGSFRAVTPGVSEMQAFREGLGNQVGYLAADLHFATVLWVARIDTRVFDFGDERTSIASDLSDLADDMALRAGVRVDRAVKTSSVAVVGDQPPSIRSATWPPVSARIREEALDQRFDTYSRLVGEAERLARKNT